MKLNTTTLLRLSDCRRRSELLSAGSPVVSKTVNTAHPGRLRLQPRIYVTKGEIDDRGIDVLDADAPMRR
jgi:hypothetical protein